MRIGITGSTLVGAADVGAIVRHATGVADAGIGAYWLAQPPSGALDALTGLTAVGAHRADLSLGTAVVPIWGRHPLVLAAQAATAAQLIDGPLTLGIGLSHVPMVRAHLGDVYRRPLQTMAEYLQVLGPLLATGAVEHHGEVFDCVSAGPAPIGPVPRVLVAAMGERMLDLAGRLADGTITAWTGPATLRDHVVPTIRRAADAAGKPPPSIGALFYVGVTDDPAPVRRWVDGWFGTHGAMPSYTAMVAREGVASPADVAVIGNEEQVAARLDELADVGVTDLVIGEIPTADVARTRALVARLAA